MKLNIVMAQEPEIIERWFKGAVNDHQFWFKIDSEGYKTISWFFSKAVPRELKERTDDIISHCSSILL